MAAATAAAATSTVRTSSSVNGTVEIAKHVIGTVERRPIVMIENRLERHTQGITMFFDVGRALQMFRQREHVRLGSEDQALAFRETWKERGQAIISSFGLPFEVDIANDPFFGRTGRLLAASQREESLKFELLVPIHAQQHPTACVSFNYHRDLFGRARKIEAASGEPAHTACVGFGVERITLALFKHHGLAVERWPATVRDVLGF